MQDFRIQLTSERERRPSGHWDTMYPLDAGDYRLSVQAGEHAHCDPRCDLDDLYGYKAFEVVIKKFYNKVSTWVHPSDIDGLDSKFSELFCSEDNIGYRVKVKDIQELYEFLSDFSLRHGVGKRQACLMRW